MRRFVDTFAGKALCHLVAMALVVPTVTLTVASRAKAQVTQLPSWAVTEFKDLKGANSFKYGQAAADAVASELAKTNRYDVVAQDTVKRSIETLGLSSPLEGLVNLSRVGQDVRANTIVAGEVIDYQVKAVGGGKQAIVAIRAVAYDVVSGLPVNGALEKGESTIRSGSVTNEALVNDAIAQAAALAVRTMSTQQPSSATVLNTTERLALINQGARSGFKTGDTVIITRGPLQIGTGRIGAVEPDQAEMTPERVIQGVAPGDRVRTVFTPPALPLPGFSVFTEKGGLNTRNNSGRRGGRSNNATLISALLVVGLVAVLLGSGNNSNSTSAADRVTAQASLDNGAPAVRLNWSPNGFYKGSGSSGNGVARWQIYRSDVSPANPVLVIGNHSTVVDTSLQNNSEFPNDVFQSNQVGGTQCTYASPVTGTRTTTPLLSAGRPVVYSVEAVYFVSSLDLPIVPGTESSSGGTSGTTSGSTSGTTSGTTTSGTTTGSTGTTASTGSTGSSNSSGTTAGTSSGSTSGSVSSCYFQSGRSSSGTATPYFPPVLAVNAAVTGGTSSSTLNPQNVPFTVTTTQSANSQGSRIAQLTTLEFSDDPTFPSKYTIHTDGTYTTSTTTLYVDTTTGNWTKKGRLGSPLSTTKTIYVRAGVRNSGDRPGPVKDNASGRRFIYSNVGQFTRPSTPPASPGTASS